MSLAVVNTGGNGATGSDTITSPSFTTTAGSLIIAVGTVYNTSGSAAGGDFTDSKGNSYTLANASLGGTNTVGIEVAYQLGGTRGSSHTISYNGPGPSTSVNIAVLEITGHDTSTPFDSSTDAFAFDLNATGGWTVVAGGAISGNQIAIYVCVIDTGSTNTWTMPTGYTNVNNHGNGATDLVDCVAYKINETGTPTVSGLWGSGTATDACQFFASFKEAVVTGQIGRPIHDAVVP